MRSDQTGDGPNGEVEAEEQQAADGVQSSGVGVEGEASPLEAVESELSSLNERFLRLAAEFENYRKRTERERGETSVRAQAQLVGQLVESLDDLQRVANFSGDSPSAESLLEGVQMVERKLTRVLENAGLEIIDARGQTFDPNLHEALMTTEAESAEEDDVVGEVFQNGYQFKGVLLRPARVQVRKFQG